jgi:anoctamin-10
MKSKRAVEKGGAPDVAMNDSPEEATFLARVRNEAELDVYDVNTDLREMVMQVRYCNASSFSI